MRHVGRGQQAIFLGCAGLFVFGLVDSVRGPIFPDLLGEFGLSDGQGSLFFFAAAAAAFFNNVLLFPWMERVGAHRTVLAYSLVQLAGLWLTGLSHRYGVTLLGSILIGLSTGGIGIAANILVAEGAHPTMRRRWLAGLHAMYGASALCGPIWVTVSYALGWGWRLTTASVGIASLGVAAFAAATRWTKPAADGETERPVESASAQPATTDSRPVRAGIYWGTLCMCYVAAEVLISSRLPLFGRREAGYSASGANALLAMFYLGLFVGRLLFAVVRTAWTSRTILIVSAAAGLMSSVLGVTHDPIWLAGAGLAVSVFYPAVMASIGDEHGATGGTLYITSWCISLQALGLMAMHVIVGYASDAMGLARALWFGPLALTATLALVLLRRPVRTNGERML